MHDAPEFTDDWQTNATLAFDFCDADKNGSVDYWEFKNCAMKIDSSRDWSGDAFDKEFAYWDMNDDQTIDQEEMWRIMERKSTTIETDDITASLSWMDFDGDGQISWTEFKAAWLAVFDSWSFRELEKVFRFADEN